MKQKALSTRLYSARAFLKQERITLFEKFRVGGIIYRQDVQDDLDRFDAAHQALTEAIKLIRKGDAK